MSRPRLAPGVRMRFDDRRAAWVLLAPETVVFPDETAVAVLRLCDGAAGVDDIVARLAAEYDAPPAEIAGDVADLLADLAARGLVTR